MEVRIIDNQPFIVVRDGKRESILTLSEVAAQAATETTQAQRAIAAMEPAAADLQSSIEAAILAGEPTSDLRARLADVQAGITQERQVIADAEQRTQQARQALIQHQATQIDTEHRNDLRASLDPLNYLSLQRPSEHHHGARTMNTSTFALDVARHRQALQEAEERHQAAQAKVDQIAARIADCQQRQEAITAARLDGTASPDSAAEFAALGADLETLQKMHSTAQAEAALISTSDAQRALSEAEARLQRNHDEEHFAALSGQVVKTEALLCQAIAAAHGVGRRLGHHTLSQSWKPGNELFQAIHYGKSPEV